MGPRGDAIAELDWCVGEILKSLDQHLLAEKTVLIFTSDNGPVVNDGYKDSAVEMLGAHKPAGPWRGGKYSSFEGGTRVPFLVRWPAKIQPSTTSEALVCQIDFLASFAALAGQVLPEGAGPDSLNTLPALLGETRRGRDHLVEQAGAHSLRRGSWKLIEASKGPAVSKQVNIETGNAPLVSLYDLASDPGETNNVAEQNQETVLEMVELLQRIRQQGTPR
jgi:arylsulfatase A-like enzyme